MRWLFGGLILLAGCGGPSYDDALQTYKTELELLDRMQVEAETRLLEMTDDARKAVDQFDEVRAKELIAKRDAEKQRLDDLITKQRERVDKARAIKEKLEHR